MHKVWKKRQKERNKKRRKTAITAVVIEVLKSVSDEVKVTVTKNKNDDNTITFYQEIIPNNQLANKP